MKDMEAYVGKMQMQLKQFGAKLDELVANADEAGTEENIDYQTHIDDLKAKYQEAQSKLDELMAAGSENWESLKVGVDSAWNELDAAFEKGNVVKLEPNVAKIEAQLKDWSTQLDGLVTGYSKSGAQAHDPYHLRLDELRTLHGVVQMKLNEFINPSGESEPWETFWASIEEDWNALDAGFKDLTR